jgi:hypothetical protein
MARRTKRKNPWTEEGWVEGDEGEDEWPDKPPSELTEEEMEIVKEKLLKYSKGTKHEGMAQVLFGAISEAEAQEWVPGIIKQFNDAADALRDGDMEEVNEALYYLAMYIGFFADNPEHLGLLNNKELRDTMTAMQEEVLEEPEELQSYPILRSEDEELQQMREDLGPGPYTRAEIEEWREQQEDDDE